MKRPNKLYILLLLLAASFCSCKKVIHLNLGSSPSKYVIEGNVTDLPGPYPVSISRSVNFDQDNTYPAVSGALVVITDNTAHISDTLKESVAGTGNYVTSVLQGVARHSYSLYININSVVFTATCTMPADVPIQGLYTQSSAFRASDLQLVPVYTDPPAFGNYYHFVEIKNDSVMPYIYIRNDQLINGQQITQPLYGGGNGSPLNPGDFVTLYMECIDSAVYQYYNALQQSQNQNSASPANPTGNITGGCLGYFSAHTVSSVGITVQ